MRGDKRASGPRCRSAGHGLSANQIITMSVGGTIPHRLNRIATHCCTAVSAFSRSTVSLLLLIGWVITAKGYSGIPDTWAMTRAVCTNRSVIIAVAGTPAFSAEMASCKLHDEQLPQSPTAEITASHPFISATTAAGAGRLASGFFRRTTAFTPCCPRRISST